MPAHLIKALCASLNYKICSFVIISASFKNQTLPADQRISRYSLKIYFLTAPGAEVQSSLMYSHSGSSQELVIMEALRGEGGAYPKKAFNQCYMYYLWKGL